MFPKSFLAFDDEEEKEEACLTGEEGGVAWTCFPCGCCYNMRMVERKSRGQTREEGCTVELEMVACLLAGQLNY